MMPFLPLGFAQPLLLLGLLALPALWWLLRLVPPRPQQVAFPPTRLLFDISPKEDTPSRTPWWLTLLRLLLAALVIFAAAGPLWNPPVASSSGGGPLALLIDDGIAAAGTWDLRLRTADEVLAGAEAESRAVALIPMSEPNRDISLVTAGAARVQMQQLRPKPHAVERAGLLPRLARFLEATPQAGLVWLSDGVTLGGDTDFVTALGRLAEGRQLTVIEGGAPPARALAAPDNSAGALTVKVLRGHGQGGADGVVRALDMKGLVLGEAPFSFNANALETDASLTMPVEIRNDIARLEIVDERSAAAVQLLDTRWRRRAIGIVTGATADTAQPLLASTYYLSRALGPFADVRMADRVSPGQAIGQFIDQRVPMMILADVGTIAGEARKQLTAWIEDGGVLVRFAGPRLAAATDDDLVPVRLRRGGRTLGGSLTWDQPQPLTGFSPESPLAGIPAPSDVTVTRQVLAEPDATLAERTWATLGDGTPLVTAQPRGKGMVVLFHVTADTRWSNLPLSGTFVDMLRRTVAIAGSSPGEGTASSNANGSERTAVETIAPARVLDGFGAFGPPTATARPVPANFTGRASADHPPGFYGPPDALLAVNALAADDHFAPLDTSSLAATREAYRMTEPQDLRGPLLILGLILLALDALLVFWLAGGLARLTGRRRAAVAAAMAAVTVLALSIPHPALAQNIATPAALSPADDFAMKATLQTHFGYIVTGSADVDEISRAGLHGLNLFLAQRTALEAGEPMGLDPERDELSFFPLIYWPVVPGAPQPSPAALQRIDTYMKQGGTILFDTRDAGDSLPGSANQTPAMQTLRGILGSLDIPELEPTPPDHVLAKTFYLMKDFPGRFSSGQLWVEALPEENIDDERPARGGDGVSSILITSNDLAGAWAMRPDGQAMLPVTGGDLRQREFAFRTGVNIVMYTLTGNYKADQVHVPALLERLGQ